ncbi:hypothetical protein VNO77_25683 [Canavalia gladiata]|uniref:Uncharacterized protein n=1 Tax=Canavalia gladiata TaxID=3824 RepID=A0AAN9QHB6_CANGL
MKQVLYHHLRIIPRLSQRSLIIALGYICQHHMVTNSPLPVASLSLSVERRTSQSASSSHLLLNFYAPRMPLSDQMKMRF